MLDRAFKYILSALQVHLLLMGYIIHLLLSTIHHFRIGERSGLLGLIGFGQVFVSRMKAEMSHLVVTKTFLSVGFGCLSRSLALTTGAMKGSTDQSTID
jgi:hypothetical protein